ncbi:hypothetical protein ACHAXN_002322 [Cyclotella atomus]
MPKHLPTHTDDGTPIISITVPQIRKKQTTKGLIRIPHVAERSKCYVEAAKVIGEREALALPYHGGRMWKCEVKLSDDGGASGSNYPTKSDPQKKNNGPTPLFRWYRSELQLATLPHILEDIVSVEHKMVHKKKWINLSNDEDDSSDEEWEEPEPTTNIFEISNLTTSAYEDSVHPLPTVTRSWISPDLQRFPSRKSAIAYSQTLVERDLLIDRVLYGYGKNGVRLRPVKPTRKAALEAGMARFLRDGLWIVGQEEMWIEKRRERFNRKNKILAGEKVIDEGDPPWRTTGHVLLGRSAMLPRKKIMGKVVGWISETDVDSKGNPGFVSTKTGQPACLFHVATDDCEYEQDFEQFELERILIDEKEVENDIDEEAAADNDFVEKDSGIALKENHLSLAGNEKSTSDCSASKLQAANVEDTEDGKNVNCANKSHDQQMTVADDALKNTANPQQSDSGAAEGDNSAKGCDMDQVTTDTPTETSSSVNNESLASAAAAYFSEQPNSANDAAKAKESNSKQLEAVITSKDSDKPATVKVTVKQLDNGELKTVTPNDSDASSHEDSAAAAKPKPKVRRSYIEPLPPSTHYRLNKQQVDKCYTACLEHYDRVMHTVKARSLHHELADGFDVLRERGKGRYDMELPEFDTEDYSFLTVKDAAWMPIIHKILGEDAILVHKGCFLSMPGSEMQVYHQDGLHLHKKIQKPCHAVNVFIPLVDYDMSNGPTEFCLGTHYLGYENFVKEMAYTPLVEAGTPVIFDYRLG